jgi:hypothetical protein
MPIDDHSNLSARLEAVESLLAGLARRLGERKRPRDGRTALTVRLGDQLVAQVRDLAQQRRCTVSQLLREALQSVIPPSSAPFHAHREQPVSFLPRRLEVPRKAISANLAEQARLAAADAATMVDRRSRNARAPNEEGMMTERWGQSSLARR